jgi:hypothetical protein
MDLGVSYRNRFMEGQVDKKTWWSALSPASPLCMKDTLALVGTFTPGDKIKRAPKWYIVTTCSHSQSCFSVLYVHHLRESVVHIWEVDYFVSPHLGVGLHSSRAFQLIYKLVGSPCRTRGRHWATNPPQGHRPEGRPQNKFIFFSFWPPIHFQSHETI